MEVYSQIQKSLKKQKSLTSEIAQVYSTLLPKRKFQYEGLTEMQCLSLVYEHLKAPLQRLKNRIQTEIKDENMTDEEVQQKLEDEQIQEQNNEQDQHQQDQVQQEKQLSDPQQGQQNYQDQQREFDQEQGAEIDEQADQIDELKEGSQIGSEEDVGLYGEQIDEEDMESYENEEMDDDPQFGNFVLNKMPHTKKKDANQEQQDEYIEDNFDQFRQIELQNNKNQEEEKPKQETSELDRQIDRLEQKNMKGKNWVLGGEIKAKQRPVNSLVDTELQFKSGVKFTHQITQVYNSSLEAIIKQRILDEIFDDRVRIIPNTGFGRSSKWQPVSTEKSSKGLAQLYQIEFKNSLGLGDNKNQKLKKQIMDSLKQINYFLDTLSNTGFALKPAARIQKDGSQAIILEDKVPVTNWDGTVEQSKSKQIFESDKQVNKKTVRLRNKRNARQRKKQQDRKRVNRSIEYGGMTKIQAQARKKIAKSKQTVKSVKYSKSSSFFNNINDKTKAGKPNANISKLKI